MYADKNYKTAKELKADFASGREITVFQPGPFGGAVRDGAGVIEGPHYPQPHRFYVPVVVKDGVVVKVQGMARQK